MSRQPQMMPGESGTLITIEDHVELTRKILEYFSIARYAEGMKENPKFEIYSDEEIRRARTSAFRLGLLRGHGRKKGRVYQISKAGVNFLKVLESELDISD